jgi:hypothetical protein
MVSPDFEPIGMQFIDPELEVNMYYFNHICPGCGSTFVVSVADFLPYMTEPVLDTILTGTDNCERRCTRLDDLAVCHAPCRYAAFRRFLLQMRERAPRQPIVAPTAVRAGSRIR